MGSKVSPTKVTAGGGFSFEDKVGAFLMCYLLAARPPLDPSLGLIQRIDFQVGADGWVFDDLLLTLKYGSEEIRCAFSIKSNPQFSKTSAPSKFVRDAWNQYLGESSTVFKKGIDRIGLITSPLDNNTKSRLENILNKARAQDPQDLLRRTKIKGLISKEEKNIFQSFSCPQELAVKYSINENHIGELLRYIEHLQFDFEHTASTQLGEAISLLRDILESNSLEEAITLWEMLCELTKKTRAQGGYIDLNKLVIKLRKRYRIKDFPEYSTTWKKIKTNTKTELDVIPDKIADTVSIDRSNEISEIINKLNKNNIIVLLGESGSGKTVIEKTIALSYYKKCKIVWVNTENLSFLNEIPTWDIFKVVPGDLAFLIIDGIDRFYEEQQFKILAKLIISCHQDANKSPWKTIVSCQPEEWARVQISLSRLNVKGDMGTFNVTNPSKEKLEPVWKKYPTIRSLSLHLHLSQFLLKPKILDLIARRITAGGTVNTRSWVGESNLITWYWEEEIEAKPNGLRRGTILKKVAEELANNLSIEILSTDLSTDELSIIEELVKDRILKKRNDRISFEHDLIADWVRQRILLDKDPNIFEYIKDKLTSPMWCKALRLTGINYLEAELDLKKWKNLFYSFSKEEDHGNLGQDLLLESSIFSANPLDNLEKQWIELKKNNGMLLRRLLNRFIYSASFPNSFALMFATHYKDEPTAEIITRYRDPYWLYWIPVIQFLHSKKTDVLQLAKKQVVKIVDKWLRFSKKDWPIRTEAAELAVEIAEEMLALKMSNLRYYDKSGLVKLAFRSELAALVELPEKAIGFALTACSRRNPSGRLLELINKYNNEALLEEKQEKRSISNRHETNFPRVFNEGPLPPPWPNGPWRRVDQDFKELCLESDTNNDALYPMILAYPERACEVILALLIEQPTPRDAYSHPLEEYTGLSFVQRWFPPFYTRGPLLYLLKSNPEQGLGLIISLINFATERWAEKWTNKGKEPPNIVINLIGEEKRYIGDAYVYYWHRDVGNVSDIIPSALMALEKWLYDGFENEEYKDKIVAFIEKILNEGSSLAFIGLLISLGKKNQELFSNYLLPLLAVAEFYSWDTEHILKSEGHQMIGWFQLGRSMVKLVEDFHTMPHRKVELSEIAVSIFISNKEIQNRFDQFRESWKKRFEKAMFDNVSPDLLENLINWFDISNWIIKEDPEQGTTVEFEMPKEIVKRRQAGFKEIQNRQMLIHLPIKFRRILEGEEKLALNDAQKIWNTIQFASDIVLSDSDFDFVIINKHDTICGGIAVLFKFYNSWLKQNPDKEKWCIEKITSLILNTSPNIITDSEASNANWVWDRFCAEVMPIIWATSPNNKLYRKCIATLAINKHYETLSILFRVASGLRGVLNEHFRQLINFIFKWSHARWKHYREQYLKKKTFDINKWLKNEIKIFIKGALSNDLIPWEIIAHTEITKSKKVNKKENKKRGGDWNPPQELYFDLRLIMAAFNWIPSLDQATNRNEREEWLSFWRQALTWTFKMIKADERGEISGTPSEWDRWLFKKIAIQILSMNDIEKPHELWEPILALNGAGHYWVEDFLMEWFINGIGGEKVADTFIKRWKEMLEYTFKTEKWNPQSGRRRYYIENLWCDLLGMNYIISSLWNDDKIFIINEMKQYYNRWAKDNLSNSKNANKFIYFLLRPSSKEILCDGLIWLDKTINGVGDDFFSDSHDDIQKPLADLLEITWIKQKDKLKGNLDAFSAFKNLLRRLVDLQNLHAIGIQQNLV